MKKTNCQDCAELQKRVVELERIVKELQAQPRENHTHFHYPPVFQQPCVSIPSTWIGDPQPQPYEITWGVSDSTGASPFSTGETVWMTGGGNQ